MPDGIEAETGITPETSTTTTTSAPPPPESDDTGMMSDDAYFAKEFGIDTEPAKAAPKAEAKPEPTKAEPKPEAKPEAEKPDAKPAETPSVPPADVEKAMRALQRGGLSAKAIERMLKEDPDDFVKSGLKLAKAQSDQDRFGTEHGELRKKLAELEKQRAEAPKVKPAPPQSLVTREIRDAYPELADTFDAIEQRMSGVQELVDARVAEALGPAFEQITGRVNFVGQMAVAQEIKAARNSLEGTYPRLKDSGEFEAVRDTANDFLKSGIAETIHDAMEKAAQIRYFHEMVADGQRAREQLTKAKDSGQPSSSATVAPSGKSMKVDDLDTEWLRLTETKGIAAANAWLDEQRVG